MVAGLLPLPPLLPLGCLLLVGRAAGRARHAVRRHGSWVQRGSFQLSQGKIVVGERSQFLCERSHFFCELTKEKCQRGSGQELQMLLIWLVVDLSLLWSSNTN